jgi:hypothetical protein
LGTVGNKHHTPAFDAAGLGSLLSLTLIVSNTGHICEMIINSATPKMTAAIFVCLFPLIMAIGVALSGLIFTAIENEDN